jgi:hypothetical protein
MVSVRVRVRVRNMIRRRVRVRIRVYTGDRAKKWLGMIELG